MPCVISSWGHRDRDQQNKQPFRRISISINAAGKESSEYDRHGESDQKHGHSRNDVANYKGFEAPGKVSAKRRKNRDGHGGFTTFKPMGLAS